MLFNCHGYFFGTKNTKVIPGVNYKFMQHLETRFNIDTTFSYIIKSSQTILIEFVLRFNLHIIIRHNSDIAFVIHLI